MGLDEQKKEAMLLLPHDKKLLLLSQNRWKMESPNVSPQAAAEALVPDLSCKELCSKLTTVEVSARTEPTSWLNTFLEDTNGLDNIFQIIERYCFIDSPESSQYGVLLNAITCLKSLVNYSTGLSSVLHYSSGVSLILCCYPSKYSKKTVKLKILILELISVISVLPGGWNCVIKAFDFYHDNKKEIHRFETLVRDICEGNEELQLKAFILINALANSTVDVEIRTTLKFEFLDRGLRNHLTSIENSKNKDLVDQVAMFRQGISLEISDPSSPESTMDQDVNALILKLKDSDPKACDLFSRLVTKVLALPDENNKRQKIIKCFNQMINETLSNENKGEKRRSLSGIKYIEPHDLRRKSVAAVGQKKSLIGQAHKKSDAVSDDAKLKRISMIAKNTFASKSISNSKVSQEKSEPLIPVLTPIIESPSNSAAPPPPPPPPPPRMPPPPPGMSKAKSTEKKSQTKPFMWNKITNTDTFWHSIQDIKVFNIKQLDVLFGASSEVRAKSAPVKSVATKASVIDAKRAYNISIVVSRFKFPVKQIKRVILQNDKETLDINTINFLKANLPTKEDEEALERFKDNIDELERADQLICCLLTIPKLETILNCMILQRTFAERNSFLFDLADTMVAACSRVTKSPAIAKLMGILLSVGNYMNEGSFRGNAKAFSIKCFGMIKGIKSTEGKTLVHFIAHSLESEIQTLTEDAEVLKKASKIPLNVLRQETVDLSLSFHRVVEDLDFIIQPFKQEMAEFISLNERTLLSTVHLSDKATKEFKTLVQTVGEDEGSTPDAVFGNFSSLIMELAKANVDNLLYKVKNQKGVVDEVYSSMKNGKYHKNKKN